MSARTFGEYCRAHGFVGDGRTRLQVATDNLAQAVREYDEARAEEATSALTVKEARTLRMAVNVAGRHIYRSQS